MDRPKREAKPNPHTVRQLSILPFAAFSNVSRENFQENFPLPVAMPTHVDSLLLINTEGPLTEGQLTSSSDEDVIKMNKYSDARMFIRDPNSSTDDYDYLPSAEYEGKQTLLDTWDGKI